MGKKKQDRHFIKEDVRMENKHMKRRSPLLVIREMQIKSTLSYHSTPLGMVKIKNSNATKYRGGCLWSRTLDPGEETGSLTSCWWECEMVQTVWEKSAISSGTNVQLPCDLVGALRERKTAFTPVFLAASSVTPPN